MKSVLFGWELGANLGHAKPLAAVASQLSGDGVRLTMAARDLMYARVAFEGVAVQLFQAPIWPNHIHFGTEDSQGGYLDVLVQIGFADPTKLGATVGGWIALIDLVAPDAIIADHSPALLLAARLRDIPVVQVGTGFTMPPVDFDRLPPLRADRAPIMPESRLVAAAAAVASEYGARGPSSLPEFFRTAERVVYGCPELDPYATFRRELLHRPPEALPEFIEPPIEPRVFAYLGPEIPHVEELLQVFAELNVPMEFYLRGEVAPLGRFLALRGHRVHEKPPSLADVLPTVSHVISAGGAFSCQAALAAGRPMLVLPHHGETELNAAALERLGVGQRHYIGNDRGATRRALIGFLRDHRLLRNARHWASVFATRTQSDGLSATTEALKRCLAQTKRSAAAPAIAVIRS